MKKIRQVISDYFGFSPKETRGFIILSFSMVFVLLVPVCIGYYVNKDDKENQNDEVYLDSLVSMLDARHEEVAIAEAKDKDFQLFSFDPNKIDKAGLLKLGIKSGTADNIIKYRKKGGVFKVKSDLSKIYGLSESLYQKLYPHIELPKEKNQPVYISNNTMVMAYSKAISPSKTFDINKADTTQLILIKGIGSKLSKRIIAFRDKLGGFVNTQQYQEIYGLDTAVVKLLMAASFVDSEFEPSKININTASIEQLKAHPYIKYKLAGLIVAYKNQHGHFKASQDLLNIKALSENDYQKLLPYIQL